ncbi:TetR/AcrR family transcriptional regulator [Nocardia sp. BMG51109]|uniref:TetR/AcrR family transcriptional regulator n=1 Tax=Nocardia sp. BMG51109 TaxID=1056816 RepID=UPI00046411E1|nr:TetR family transcriptional regulator [Nocardia sp. BMG51109]
MSRGERARADILDAAERLIAERGAQVPLREIAVAAGQRNNSAVNYHFRNRHELIHAVVERRLAPMERERAEMLATLGNGARRDGGARRDVDALLRVLVLPLTTVDSPCYARFLQAAALYLPTDLDGTQGTVWPRVLNELARAIPTSDAAAKRGRIAAVGTAMFALLAEWERKAHSETGSRDFPEDDFPEDLVVMLAAMLTAPVRVHGEAAGSPTAG